MKINVKTPVYNHAGGPATEEKPLERLKRTVLTCMLFEDNFYENGVKAVDRIKELCHKCRRIDVLMLANEAGNTYKLRHVPLLLLVEALKMVDKSGDVADTIFQVINRPDQMTDLLSLYWKDGKKPLSHQLRKGLAKAFTQFDAYQLGKYNRDNPIKLRDVMFLCHPKPKDADQAEVWKKLANKTLESPDTWEVRLSSGADKKESFSELLSNGKMGKLAILRNLRNMHDSGISKEVVAHELLRNPKEMLPFQYLAAARECPQWEDIVDPAMIKACSLKPKLPGRTFVIVDVSGSMNQGLSSKGKMTRMDAACGLAILLRECCENGVFLTFSERVAVLPPRQGMALRDSIVGSQPHGNTFLGMALMTIFNSNTPSYERVIVITDEQSHDETPYIAGQKNYILNIAPYQNGIGKKNQWTTISGFSEASIDFIRELESAG